VKAHLFVITIRGNVFTPVSFPSLPFPFRGFRPIYHYKMLVQTMQGHTFFHLPGPRNDLSQRSFLSFFLLRFCPFNLSPEHVPSLPKVSCQMSGTLFLIFVFSRSYFSPSCPLSLLGFQPFCFPTHYAELIASYQSSRKMNRRRTGFLQQLSESFCGDSFSGHPSFVHLIPPESLPYSSPVVVVVFFRDVLGS